MNAQPVTYAPAIRWRLIRVGLPTLILLLGVTAYVLLNAETFERNAAPDSISIPVFIVLIWSSVSVLAFVPLLVIGGSQWVVTPDGFAFSGRLKGVYLNIECAWDDVLAAEHKGVEMHNGGGVCQSCDIRATDTSTERQSVYFVAPLPRSIAPGTTSSRASTAGRAASLRSNRTGVDHPHDRSS